jgi:tetratricopeptide (TPR) repeat protein
MYAQMRWDDQATELLRKYSDHYIDLISRQNSIKSFFLQKGSNYKHYAADNDLLVALIITTSGANQPWTNRKLWLDYLPCRIHTKTILGKTRALNAHWATTLGAAYRTVGKLNKAARLLDHAIKITPVSALSEQEHWIAMLERAQVYFSRGDFKSARDLTWRIIDESPQFNTLKPLGVPKLSGLALYYLGQYAAAESTFQIVLGTNPNDVDARRMLAFIYRDTDRTDQAVDILREISNLSTDDQTLSVSANGKCKSRAYILSETSQPRLSQITRDHIRKHLRPDTSKPYHSVFTIKWSVLEQLLFGGELASKHASDIQREGFATTYTVPYPGAGYINKRGKRHTLNSIRVVAFVDEQHIITAYPV